MAFDEADRLHGVAGHLNNGVGDVLLSGAAERFVMRAGGDHDIVHVRDVILAGHFRLLLRIHFAIVHVSAGIGVFRGQILEGLVRGAREADDVHVLLELSCGAAGLIGEGIELFGGDIEALFMAVTEKIHQAEDHEHQKRDGERIGAKLGGAGAEERDEIAIA